MNENPKHSGDGRDSGGAWLQQGPVENYNKPSVGMGYEAVIQLLGLPERCVGQVDMPQRLT